jgi:tetratricopeptide (TPR) repeat protein
MSPIPVPVMQAALAQLDARLDSDPGAAGLRFERAGLLEMLGRVDEALNDYIAVLGAQPAHVEALAAVGMLFIGAGRTELARTFLNAAIVHEPGHATALANLAYLEMIGGGLAAAHALFETALCVDPTLAVAHRGLADIARRRGDLAVATLHEDRSMRCRPLATSRYIGSGPPVSVLALWTTACGNIVSEAFFDSRVVLLTSLIVDLADAQTLLPPHDLVFNIIGDGDLCTAGLATAAAIVRRSGAPVINHPDAVAATTRAGNARRLTRLAGVVAPRTSAVERADLIGPHAAAFITDSGFTFPLLVRAPGFHRGDHFVKVDAAADLEDAIAALPGDTLLLIAFLDTRDAAGLHRKYRVIIVDGQLYPVHLAVSAHWKVHYFSADMADNTEHRALDAAFLADMEGTLGTAAVAALRRIAAVLDLDYGGIDFTVDGAGNVVVFEANASMIAAVPEPDARWDYRRAPIRRIQSAVRATIRRRASGLPRGTGRSGPPGGAGAHTIADDYIADASPHPAPQR